MQSLSEMVLNRCKEYRTAGTGDRTAVIFDDILSNSIERASYNQLDQWAHKVTSILRELEVAEEPVGIVLRSCLVLPAVLIGVMEVPAAFSPIDPELPAALLRHQVATLHMRLLIVDSSQLPMVKEKLPDRQFCVTDILGLNIHVVLLMETTRVRWRHPMAYVVTTSGTTGLIKVVQVPHKCIMPNITHLSEIYQLKPSDLVFQAAPLTFDPSIVEIFTTLSAGSTLLMVPDVVKMMPSLLNQTLVDRNKVNVMQVTPVLFLSLGSDMARSGLLGASSALRVLALGGEAFPSLDIIRSWRQDGNQTEFINLYGITEVSSWASYHQVTDQELQGGSSAVPLGIPLKGSQLEIKCRNGKSIVGHGCGQLFIGGSERVCLLSGEDAIKPGIMRGSGDLVQRDDAGRLWYVGRMDGSCQVKRNGKRFSLTQIEQVALSSGVAEQAVALLLPHHLYLFIKPVDIKQQRSEVVERLKVFLQENLPRHQCPDHIELMGGVPMTRHGKVDRYRLVQLGLEHVRQRGDIQYINMSEDTLHRMVRGIWKECLGLDKDCDIDDDSAFLALGGDSVAAVRAANMQEERMGKPMPLMLDKLLGGTFRDVVDYMAAYRNNFEFTNKDKTEKRPSHNVKAGESCSVELKNTAFEKSQTFPTAVSSSNKKHVEPLELNAQVSLSVHKPLLSSKRPTGTNSASFIPCKKYKLSQNYVDLCVVRSHGNGLPVMYERPQHFAIQRCSRVTVLHRKQVPNSVSNISASLLGRSETGSVISSIGSVQRQLCVTQLWKHNTRKCVDASPLVVSSYSGGKVFIGSHSHLFAAVSMETGEILWECQLGDRIESSACSSLCGRFVVVGCYDGLIYTLNQETGEVIWTVTTRGQVKCSPCVDSQTGLVYIGSHDQNIYCLDVQKCEVKWKWPLDGSSVFGSPGVSTSPHLIIVVTLAGTLAALCPESGEVIWKAECGKPLFSSPATLPAGVVVGSVDGKLLCYSYTGVKLWEFETDKPVFSSPCLWSCHLPVSIRAEKDNKEPVCCHPAVDCILFGSHDNHVYCVTCEGQLKWKYKMSSFVYASPFVFRWPHRGLHKRSTILSDKTTKSVPNSNIEGNNSSNSIKSPSKMTRKSDPAEPSKEAALESLSSGEPVAEKSYHCPLGGSACHCLVAACATDGLCCILRLTDGFFVGQYQLPGEVFSSPVVVDDKLVVGCRDNYLYCLDMNSLH